MTPRVLVINITRMGDLVQTVPLLSRLQAEWPGVAIDLVVDTAFGSMARMLPGVQRVLEYDFNGLIDASRTHAKDVVALYQQVATWAKPLAATGYDRIVNLTFNRRSALLARYIGAPDIRGAVAAADGTCVVRNPWLAYFTDLHHHRRSNRFNLVDLYGLGGSRPGAFAPLTLNVATPALDDARALQSRTAGARSWIAVQVGASDVMKAWRPEYFGRTMAAISRRGSAAFVVIGTAGEAEAVRAAVQAYRAAGGTAPVSDAVGRTTLPQLVALLSQCQLLLTNDTGPMHLAVAVGTPVVDLSVGHVDFRETGPYGAGHWVIQPELACAPCGFEQVCAHHACKDRLIPEQVAQVCLHALGHGPVPSALAGMRLYESGVDEDGLATYRLRAGQEEPVDSWYGRFWRRFWYREFTGCPSRTDEPEGPCPDLGQHVPLWTHLDPIVNRAAELAERLVALCQHPRGQVASIKAVQQAAMEQRQQAVALAMASSAFGPVTVAFLRELHNVEATELPAMARQHATAFRTWRTRLLTVMQDLSGTRSAEGRARKTRGPLPVMAVRSSGVTD